METALGRKYAMTAPHRLTALVGRDVLEAGGSAIEAMVAAAASIAVTYPHMNGIGGDAFWLIKRPGQAPIALQGCGGAAALATPEWYTNQGFDQMLPSRGPLAALTVPGALGSWQAALALLGDDARFSLAELLAPAVRQARDGVAMSRNQAQMTADKHGELAEVSGFAPVYLENGAAPAPGALMVQSALADTLEHLGREGIESFYRGDLAATHGAYLEGLGSPLRASDFNASQPHRVTPLEITTSLGTLYNMTPPTQGMASLAILGIFDRLGVEESDGFAHIHGLVEAIKRAYRIRNAELGDPDYMRQAPQSFLTDALLAQLAGEIDMQRALPWPEPERVGDTIWMGAADADGTVVSFIQSVFWEFGSGVICPETGVLFQNRGAGFDLGPGPNQLAPGKRPFHTLNPALAVLKDGRVFSYGTQGGDGQPQTQAAVFTRYAQFGVPLQEAVKRPRWLLGKAWGQDSTTLKLESDFDPDLVAALADAGHNIEMVPACNSLMGHAGAVVLHPDGLVEAATDPRSDGAALAL
ncbi:MAG: gamma-glutamyltransferase family protein [Mangrovicoccus sp.]|nr:gamma-glutamyltransferase family protein [Mangrovicoccus sp.]